MLPHLQTPRRRRRPCLIRHSEWLQLAETEIPIAGLGTIHILRNHLYSAKLNLTSYFFTKKMGVFGKTKEFLFQHYI